MEFVCYLFRVDMYAWRFAWSCLVVCDRCVSCPVLICLCWCLLMLVAMFDGFCCYVFRVVMYVWRLSWSCLGVCDRRSLCPYLRILLFCCDVCVARVALFVRNV